MVTLPGVQSQYLLGSPLRIRDVWTPRHGRSKRKGDLRQNEAWVSGRPELLAACVSPLGHSSSSTVVHAFLRPPTVLRFLGAQLQPPSGRQASLSQSHLWFLKLETIPVTTQVCVCARARGRGQGVCDDEQSRGEKRRREPDSLRSGRHGSSLPVYQLGGSAKAEVSSTSTHHRTS